MASDMSGVYCIDDLIVRVTRTDPPWLIIFALGRAATTGWSDAQLSMHVHITPPEDGVQGYEFVARAPAAGDITLPVLTPISAVAELQAVDIDNYWGPGKPLKGIRVSAVENAKTVEVVGQDEAAQVGALMTPRATVSYVATTTVQNVPGFQADIRPLFRDRDATVMLAVAGFDLHSYDDVKANADAIARKLRINMPCDGLWPEADIVKFESWIAGGMLA